MRMKPLVYFLVFVSIFAFADQPTFNGSSGSVTFAKYILVAQSSIDSGAYHMTTPVPGNTITFSFFHTYDPELGLMVMSWKGQRLDLGAQRGRIDDCKYGDAQNDQFQTWRLAAWKTVMSVTAGHPAPANFEFTKAINRFSDNIGNIPVMFCSPNFKGK